jgi:RNA-directed DNA polymerase
VSKKSVQRLKAKVANLLTPGNHDPWLDVRDAINAFLLQVIALAGIILAGT